VLLLLFISVSSQSQDIDADTDLPESDDSVSSSEETSGNHGRISDLPSESDVEERGITTHATVTTTTDDTTKCTSQCCLNYNEAFQPVNKLYEALCLQKVEIFTTMV